MSKPPRELICAVRAGDIDTVKRMISSDGPHPSQGYNLLCCAVRERHNKVVKELLLCGSKVNSECKQGTDTPLHLAANNDDTEIVDMLLDRGAQISAINCDGMTPFHCAAQKGSVTVAEHLLNRGADVNCSSRGGKKYTPLHYACKKSNVQIVNLLLSHGADINGRTNDGSTALHIAAWRRHAKLMKLLLDHGADINARTNDGSTALCIAARRGEKKLIKLLLGLGAADVNARNCDDGLAIPQIAFVIRDFETLRHMLESRPDVNDEINRSLLPAAVRTTKYNKERNIVDTLMTHGFNITPEDAHDIKLLDAAVKNGHFNVVKDLLKCGAHVHLSQRLTAGCTFLHIAAKERNIEIAKLLIQHKIDVNAKNDKGQTPIFYAIENKDETMRKLLRSSGAKIHHGRALYRAAIESTCIEIVEIIFKLSSDSNINVVDESGMTPLDCDVNRCVMILYNFLRFRRTTEHEKCHEYTRLELAKKILIRRASVDVPNEKGYVALCAAAARKYTKVVEILLDYNPIANELNYNGNVENALYYAAGAGYERICKILLENGAKVNAKKKMNGRTALHIACERNQANIVKMLVAFGADIDCRDNVNETPLHSAAFYGNSGIVHILLHQFCAEVDFKDVYGRTALHAAKMGCKKGCRYSIYDLLVCGSDINATCNNDRTPIFTNSPRLDCSNEEASALHSSTSDTFMRHAAKMIALNLFVNEDFLWWFGSSFKPSSYGFEREIEKLKSTNISDSTVTFYDVLTKHTTQVALYAKNKSIAKVLKSNHYKKIFPAYFDIIRNRFRRGKKLNSLFNASRKALHHLFGSNLPECPCRELFSYLSINDLKNLIKAGSEDGHEECIN